MPEALERQVTIDQALRMLTAAVSMPKFTGRHIPVYKVAEIIGKNPTAVREGIKRGKLPIGCAIPTGEKNGRETYTYYISPKLFWEYTGALVEGVDEGEVDE